MTRRPGPLPADARPPDLRLVGPAAAAWLGAAAGPAVAARLGAARPVVAGPVAAVVVPALVAAAGFVVVALARRSGAARAVAALCVCGVAGMVAAGLRSAAVDSGPLGELAASRSRVVAEVVLTGDPARVRSTVVGARRFEGSTVAPARLERLDAGGRSVRLRHPVRLLSDNPGWLGRLPGERMRVRGTLAPAYGGDGVAAVLRTREPPEPLRGASWLARAAGRVRAGLHEAAAVLPEHPRGLLPGLVIGDTSRLDPALREDFRRTGMTHLVAVSGSNLAIVLAVALYACRRAGVPPRLSLSVALLVLAGFVVLVRPSPSVLRAAAMGALALVAIATDRVRAGVPILAATVLGLVLVVPSLARSPGFALSTAATAGLLVVAPPLRARLARRWPGWLADAVAVPFAAQLACAPVLAALFGRVSLVGVPANLLAVPAVGVATVAGLAAAVVAPVCLPVARLAALAAGVPAAWLVFLARSMSRAPAGQLAWPRGPGGALLLAAAVWLGLRLLRRRWVAVATASSLLVGAGAAVVTPGWPPAGWVFVACDVGQGDALVLRDGGGAVVVDTGPDPALVDRCLGDLGVRRIAAVVLTHMHADHVEGLPGVLRGRAVATVLVGPFDEPADERRRVDEWARGAGVPVRRAAAGERGRSGRLEYEVLGPERVLRGTDSDPNNSSLLLRVRAGGLTLLLTGDVEQPAQRAALATAERLRVDVLKVPHHGSDRQLDEFLAATRARVAVTSVGPDNPYGHPAARTLSRIERAGMASYRTDLDGDVAVLSGRAVLRVVPRRLSGVRGLPWGRGAARSLGEPPAPGVGAAAARTGGAIAFGPPRPGIWCPAGPRAPPVARGIRASGVPS